MSFDQTKWIWMNGRIVDWHNATLHVSSHALHYGTGVFEGMRCYETADGPAVFRMKAHLNRFLDSAEMYGIEIPYTLEEMEEAVCETIALNGFASCYVRPICYYGSAGLNVHPRNCPVEVAILAWPWAAYLGDESLEKGVRVRVSSITKFHSRMMPTTAKACGTYVNSMLAVREAMAAGYDEALLLDEHGNVAEGSGENLFIVNDGNLLTNDERSSILMGITRDAVIKLARDLGYRVNIGMIRLGDLYRADEAFFTGTAAEITPIRELNGKQIGVDARGPVTEKLQQAFFAAVFGRDSRYGDWLHHVAQQPAAVGL
ncbi:MAG TPA: branched-chain amino acid transaminase [Blastocatellia bacterium]|nr:branched-chain amino acid transaminase [Blastocatellia bacterium]